MVCVCVSDCITDIRQSLAAPRLISKSDPVPATGTCSIGGLGELLRKMHSSLVSQIKSVLTHLQVSSVNYMSVLYFCLQCFDAVGWAAGRASGL